MPNSWVDGEKWDEKTEQNEIPFKQEDIVPPVYPSFMQVRCLRDVYLYPPIDEEKPA
jgi:hypothetical protein